MALRLKDTYHLGEQVADDPLVQVIDDFVTETERNHIMRLTADKLDTALVSAVGDAKTSDGRTGSVAWVKHDQTPIVRGLVKRVSNLVGIPVRHAESLQVVHYGETQEYKPHFDAYDMTTEKGQQRTAKGGQRLVTALMYLNDVEDGGSTIFPKLELEVEAQPGRMVIFHNVGDHTLVDLTRHRRALHGGSPVWGGQKWACNLWFRQFTYSTKPARGQIRGRSGRATPPKKRR
jgi:prolyl 4-hydroxylase